MEELLPLIIGILWLLYTFYSRNQKKRSGKQPVRKEGREKKDPTFLEQLLAAEGIQFDEEPSDYMEEEEERRPSRSPEVVSEKKTTPFLNAELSDYIDEGQLQFSRPARDTRYSRSVFEGDLTTEEDTDTADFNLRDAVVYSAILNAPYIHYK